VSDDVTHLFAAVGRHDQIVKALAARYAGLVDTIQTGAGDGSAIGLPPDLIQDIRRLPQTFQGYAA
jgi:hypothetical protein